MTPPELDFRLRVLGSATLLVWAVLLFSPTTGFAANGDCGQPVSNGAAPVATDCLFILNAAVDGNGHLDETSQRLEYTCGSGTADDGEDWEWIATALPLDSNWEIQIDLVNLTVPSADNHVNSFGFGVYNPADVGDEVYAEMYASSLGGPPARNGFYGEMYNDDAYVGEADSGGSDVTTGAVHMLFDSSSKVIYAQYDTDPSNGYQWITFGTFGIAGFGGSNGNANWGLSDSDVLNVYVYGFSARMKIGAGKMWGDNFVVTGGVPAP